MHILFVEDETLIRAMMCEALTDAGFVVSEAGDGDAALAKFREHRADLLIVDIGLPGSLDGWALAEEVRSLAPNVPIIFATGKGDIERRVIPNSVFCEKPYAPSLIIRIARALVDRTLRKASIH
jgi:DNA-binding response OmpR family regulator